MIDNIHFVPIGEAIARVTRHPMLQKIDFEAALQYTLDFIADIGLPNIYENKTACVDIEKYKGFLPCDVLSIDQVQNDRTKTFLRSMTDTFGGTDSGLPAADSFMTSGRVITTSFKEGRVKIAYKAIPVDEDGVPMLPDNPVFMRALEAYIKAEVFSVYFDEGKIKGDVMNKAEQDYYARAHKCKIVFHTPSKSEMETITGMMHRMIPAKREFQRGFATLGDREYYKNH